jgi:hypothetical protein
MGQRLIISESERSRIKGLYENNMDALPTNELTQKAQEAVQMLSPEEQEALTNYIQANPSLFLGTVKREVAQEKEEQLIDLGEGDDMDDSEFDARRILHKIVQYVGIGSGLAIVPAAMFIGGGVAAALGVTAVAGAILKDVAFWKKGGGHHYKAQDKSDAMDMNEQGKTKLKLKRGDILTVIKKNDTSKSPVEMLAGVSASYDSGMGQRIEVKVTGGDKVQLDLDPVKMEFGDYKITKVNGQPLNKPVVKTQPTQQPIKPGSKGPVELIHIVNVLSPNKVILKLKPDYDLTWSEGSAGGVRQLVGKTDKGETVVMDYECGIGEENIIFDFIVIGNGKYMPKGKYMSVNRRIVGDCPVG